VDVEVARTRSECDHAKDPALSGANGIGAVMKPRPPDPLLFPGAGANRASLRG